VRPAPPHWPSGRRAIAGGMGFVIVSRLAAGIVVWVMRFAFHRRG
jgi:hypothetical protein